jgi:hypothetical protein
MHTDCMSVTCELLTVGTSFLLTLRSRCGLTAIANLVSNSWLSSSGFLTNLEYPQKKQSFEVR